MYVDTHSTENFDGTTIRARKRPTRLGLAVRLFVMGLLLVVVFGGLYGYAKMREQAIASFFASNKPPPTPVAAAEATLLSVPKYLAGIGSLAAVHQVMVAPEVGGRVVQIFFEAGAQVKAGDPLVQLNDKPEQGDLANYRSQAKVAELNLARSKELVTRNFTPQSTVDQNQALLDQANAGIAKTQAIIGQKLIRAPFDGVLGIRQVELGQYVTPGGTIVSLTDLGTLYVNITLPEQMRSQVQVGQAVRIAVDAYPDRRFEARVSTIEPQINAEMRAMKVQATMANPENRLLPGMFAKAEVVLPPEPNVVTVPETAVDYTVYGDSVYVVRQDGTDADGKPVLKAMRVAVKTGDRFDNRVAILSGLKAGDRVVASGQLKVSNGAPVVVKQSDALDTPATLTKN